MDINMKDLSKRDIELLKSNAVLYKAEQYVEYRPHKAKEEQIYHGGVVVYVYDFYKFHKYLAHKYTLPSVSLPLQLSKITIFSEKLKLNKEIKK